MGKQQVRGPHQEGWTRKAGPYSNGVVTSGTRTVYLSGQVARDATGTLVGQGDIAAQFRQVMSNIIEIVQDAGGTADDIVHLVTYVCRGGESADKPEPDYTVGSTVIEEVLSAPYPTHTLVEVRRMIDPDALVETYAIAVLD